MILYGGEYDVHEMVSDFLVICCFEVLWFFLGCLVEYWEVFLNGGLVHADDVCWGVDSDALERLVFLVSRV